MNFETVIGLEVHVELNTNSKIFSPTSAHFGNDQNANTNVIDWSFPGVLPVLNKGVSMPVSRQLLPSTWTSTKRCTLTARTTLP